ncbi:limbic system-associated membrane protein [Gambusia affinis]|uniref:limbic system-associated membrane protein n=1 Tax=Gambusia affinis TaxID=33528 RepID=UPI001CDC9B8D|nr:limbic system-associated membrane protein [Gambusia affinis]
MAHHQQSCCFLIILCVRGILGGDWSVVVPTHPLCAAIGSSVVFPCSYDYPPNSDEVHPETGSNEIKVLSEIWCLSANRCVTKSKVFHSAGGSVDLSYQGRVQYLGKPGNKNCSLRISNLKESDSGTYVFYFLTNHATQKLPPQRGLRFLVAASCTSVVVMASPSRVVREGTALDLLCCVPTANSLSLFTWHRTKGAKLEHTGPMWKTRKVTSDQSGRFYCQVQTGDQTLRSDVLRIDVQHPPRNMIISTWREKTTHPMTLTCSSEASPVVRTYVWYEGEACLPAADLRFHRGTSIQATLTGSDSTLTSANITAEDNGVYCCVARNKLGFQKASLTLTYTRTPTQSVSSKTPMTLIGGIIVGLLAIFAIIIYFIMRKIKRARRIICPELELLRQNQAIALTMCPNPRWITQ